MKKLILTVVKILPKSVLVAAHEPLSSHTLAYISKSDAECLELHDVSDSKVLDCVSYTFRTLCNKDGEILTAKDGSHLHTIEVQR